MKQDMIVILDLGSEENPRLAREIRALGVYSEIYPHDITLAELNALPNVKGVILNGGPNHVVDGVEIDACSDIYGCGRFCSLATKAARRGPRMRRSGKPSCPNLYSMPAVRSPTGTWRTSLQTRSS